MLVFKHTITTSSKTSSTKLENQKLQGISACIVTTKQPNILLLEIDQ